MIELKKLLEEVVLVAREAATFIKNERLAFNPARIEQKGYHDLVSYVDKESEKLIVSKLESVLPEAGFITEEKTTSKRGERYNWIIDPLDGTTNFIHDLPAYCVSIALTDHRTPILGVVFEVTRSECYSAIKGGGAYLNNQKIRVSSRTTLAESLLATGFPYYDYSYQKAYLDLFQRLMKQCRGLRRIGSAALDLAYVAAGKFDGFYEYNLNDYDMAAGVLLVQEAGGVVLDFKGGTNMLDERSIIAGNPFIAPRILEAVRHSFY